MSRKIVPKRKSVVALKYDAEKGPAPKVTAKGEGLGQAPRSWARRASTHAAPLFCQPFAGIER